MFTLQFDRRLNGRDNVRLVKKSQVRCNPVVTRILASALSEMWSCSICFQFSTVPESNSLSTVPLRSQTRRNYRRDYHSRSVTYNFNTSISKTKLCCKPSRLLSSTWNLNFICSSFVPPCRVSVVAQMSSLLSKNYVSRKGKFSRGMYRPSNFASNIFTNSSILGENRYCG